eukprot:scaffold42468_cov40-Phaeocystis_antarctica.AAC.5
MRRGWGVRRGKWSLTTAAVLAAPRFVAQASGTSGGIEERGVGRDIADEGGVEEGAALAGAGEPHRLPWVKTSERGRRSGVGCGEVGLGRVGIGVGVG